MRNTDRHHKKILFLEKEISRIKHLHQLNKISAKEARKQIKMYEAVLAELVADMPQYYQEIHAIKKEHRIV